MGTLRLDEVAVQAVIAKLQGGWLNRINEINVEKADSVVCSAPDNSMFFMGRMSQIPDYPAVFVMAGPTTYREEGAHSMLSTIEIYVWICERDQTGPRIATRLMRQARAAIEVLYDDSPQEQAYVAGSTSVLGPYRIFPVRSTPGAVFQPSGEETWVGSYMIVLKAEQQEL